MSFPQVIRGSVGRQGVNNPDDMRLVEDLLCGNHDYVLRRQYLPPTTVAPGECDPVLIEAILDFQKGSMPVPNGRVDPPTGGESNINRLTWERLVRPPLQQLPQTLGRGYYSYSHGPQRQFGTPMAIKTLEQVAGIFFTRMRYNEPAIPGNRPYREIGIGDISFVKGGPIPPHGEHRWGTDVDIRPLRKDGQRAAVSIADGQYDREATRVLVEALLSHMNVVRVRFNDTKIKGVIWTPKHDNHLHVDLLD
ncbi:MAG: hypothetical protein H6970_03595 [Gammaproteobacteria bacterium]|nr:hypothetical protein [Gammaproteobacteria bacterium]